MIEFETPKEQKESSMKKALEKLENGGIWNFWNFGEYKRLCVKCEIRVLKEYRKNYKKQDNKLILTCINVGSHSEIF